jgi:predicted ABC-class ATPase
MRGKASAVTLTLHLSCLIASQQPPIPQVNISPFIANLPYGRDTQCFDTPDASGSTSQAANIMEAVEIGAKTLLIDEDTCATNFMIRDERMAELVSKDKEPITPFIHKVSLAFFHMIRGWHLCVFFEDVFTGYSKITCWHFAR